MVSMSLESYFLSYILQMLPLLPYIQFNFKKITIKIN